MAYLQDPLYNEAIKTSDKKEYVKSMDFWVPLMNKYISNGNTINEDLFNGTLMVEFLQSLFGYAVEINRDNIFADDSEDEEEDSDMEEDSESEDEQENKVQNTKFFQFGLKEEDELSDNDNDESQLGITNFQDLLTGGRNAFHSITDFILTIINKFNNENNCQNSIYIILADCFKELDNIKDSINYYNMALNNSSETDYNGKICILLRITELIKWSDNAISSPKYLSIYKKKLEEAIDLIKTSKDKEYSAILPELNEEMDELKTQSSQDIRSLHPEFDFVLKRALGQISTDSIQDENVNDLSSLIQKKKPKKK